MLNRVKVWGLHRPQHDFIPMVLKPVLGLLASVLVVINLLENDISWSLAIIVQAGFKVLIHNPDIKVPIHSPINLDCISWPIPKHTTIIDPPPNLSVPSTSWSFRPSPFFFQAHLC